VSERERELSGTHLKNNEEVVICVGLEGRVTIIGDTCPHHNAPHREIHSSNNIHESHKPSTSAVGTCTHTHTDIHTHKHTHTIHECDMPHACSRDVLMCCRRYRQEVRVHWNHTWMSHVTQE